MELIILLAGFVGAWLLVAGSMYQAALELKEENVEMDRLRQKRLDIPRPKRVSAFWWFLPPIKFALEKKSNDAFRSAYLESLNATDLESTLSFFNKASAWMFVGLGSFMIAAKETYELYEHLHIAVEFLLATLVVLVIACFSNTVIRMRRSDQLLQSKKN